MRTFAQKQNQPQRPVSSKNVARSHMATRGLHHRADLILHLQRTIKNQAVQRMLQTDTEDLNAGLTSPVSPHFGHDFSRIPMHHPTAGAIQTKLVINKPGDEYEQEADRVAEQVMRIPEPQLQRACPCGGGCPKCQTNQPSQEHERLQPKRVQASDTGQIAALPSVHEVLAAPAQPLDLTIREFLEPRFGHDFSKVRVHSGAAAERSARDVSAKAYTVGHNIVFGAGRFQPGTHEGRRLLAHELTHVLQQSRSAGNVPQLQRDGPKPELAAARLETAKENLKAKYGLKDISEQGGVAWTERQLKTIDATFSKMSPEEQKRLQGVTLVLTDKFPSKRLKGKTFPIGGKTYGTYRVELTSRGVRQTVLHEAGHLIHNTAIANAEKLFEGSQIKADLETARNFLNASSKQRFLVSNDERPNFDQFKIVMAAAEAFEQSDDAGRAANRATLEQAAFSLPLRFTSSPDAKALSAHADKIRAFVVALLLWSDEREKVVGPVKRLDEFVSIVKTHRLARRSFPAFTSYAEANWPDNPAEFFAEAYDSWRKNPADMRRTGRALFDWFEKGGHLGPKLPPPPITIIPIPKKIPILHENAPLIEELLLEAGEMFLPAIEGGVHLIP